MLFCRNDSIDLLIFGFGLCGRLISNMGFSRTISHLFAEYVKLYLLEGFLRLVVDNDFIVDAIDFGLLNKPPFY